MKQALDVREDVREAERHAFRLANFEDGFLEIYLGATFILMSCYPLTGRFLGSIINLVLVLGLILLMAGLLWLCKKTSQCLV